MELNTLPIGKLKPALKVCFDHNVIPVIMGPPGCGKTQMAIQLASEIGWAYAEMLLAGRDVGDIYMPYVTNSALHYHYNPNLPVQGWKLAGIPTILNIDEFSGAKPLMQNMLLKVLDERRIGETKLDDEVRIMATGNRAWDLAHVEQLSAALGNRATFITVAPDLDAWVAWAVANNVNPVTIAWVKFDPTYLHSFDPEQFLAGDPAFCSPRSNERLGRIQTAYEAGEMDDEIFRSLICGTIGYKIGIKYYGFQKMREEMPDPIKIVEGTETKIPKAPEVIYATIFATLQRTERKNIGNVLTYIKKLAPEWHAMFSTTLVAAKPILVGTSEYGAFAASVANR